MARVIAVAAAFIVIACSGALASEPGQPLDCSDWVAWLPGYTCENGPLYDPKGSNLVTDNQGYQVTVPIGTVPSEITDPVAVLVWRRNPVTGDREVIGYIKDRSSGYGPGGTFYDMMRATAGCPDGQSTSCGYASLGQVLSFDAVAGVLSIPVISQCFIAGVPQPPPYEPKSFSLRIKGFTPLLEIFQSYVPAAPSLTFRVPYMPEGMPAADSFDSFWGTLSKPIDFSQAHPLSCDYPAAAPHVGDFLTVADTVPTPAPGQGVYYVTSATYQGATRYGRKTTAGHLSGRDPVLLPVCVGKGN